MTSFLWKDTLEDDYMTLSFDSNDDVTLVDCFVLGLLKLTPESNLKIVDFTRFDKGKLIVAYNSNKNFSKFSVSNNKFI